jgi:hypothetical protein
VVHVINEVNEKTQGSFQIEGGWKFLINPQTSPNVLDTFEMYNTLNDPNETTDLKLVYPDLFEEMKSAFEVIKYFIIRT